MQFLIRQKESFAFESTLAGLSYLKLIKQASLLGYDVILFFVWLNNINLAKERVAARVSKGGHNINEEVIERRYKKGVQNFIKYSAEVDDWYIYDNSGKEYALIAKSINARKEIYNFEVYNIILRK